MAVPGDVLAGRYRLVHRVATGGMGSVWEAWDELLQRRVAIKELLSQPGSSKADSAMACSRVIREARITARLHHPHAVALYDVIDHGGQPCLVLQFVPSRTLNSILAEQGLLQVRFVTGVGAEIASALAAAHQVGIIHRDVKPSNVLITPAGGAMITDFGISHAAGDVSLTSTGMVTGTTAFLAPEVARGDPSGFPADVFSLGATLYAALEGTPPFGTDQNAMALLHKVASGQIIPPRRSGGLTALVGQMLAIDPAARPAMSTVARLLTDLTGQRSAAMPAPQPQPQTIAVPPRTVREWPTDHDQGSGPRSPAAPDVASAVSAPANRNRRRPLGVLLTAVGLLLLAGLGTWLLVRGSGSAQPAAGRNSVSVASSATWSSASALPPQRTSVPTTSPSTAPSARRTVSHPATHGTTAAQSTARPPATTAAQSTARPPATTAAARQTTSHGPAQTTSHTPKTTSSTTRSGTARVVPTSAQLAAAVTDYYALQPGNTDLGWAHLTSNFQTGTAQNRQYYQRFWDSVQRVTATDVHGASPDTAEATITYYFKDGRTAVEPTVYSLVPQGDILTIDSSTVLSSTTQ